MDIGNRSPQILEALLGKRQILLQGDVGVESQMRIHLHILYLNAISNAPISLLIDSGGGDGELAVCICDAVEQSEAPVSGIVIADAFSSAFRILQVCHTRIAYPNARLKFHAPRSPGLRIDEDRFFSHYETLKKIHEKQLHVYAKRSRQPIVKLRQWAKQEKQFTAVEGIKLGFLDGIVPIPQRIKPSGR